MTTPIPHIPPHERPLSPRNPRPAILHERHREPPRDALHGYTDPEIERGTDRLLRDLGFEPGKESK